MEDEVLAIQRRLELTVREIDRETQRLEAIQMKARSSLFGSRLRSLNPDIDPEFDITFEELRRRSERDPERIKPALKRAKRVLKLNEEVLSDQLRNSVKILWKIDNLKKRLAGIDEKLSRTTPGPSERALLDRDRRTVANELSEKRGVLDGVKEAIQRAQENVRKFRFLIKQMERDLLLFEARRRRRRRRRGRGAARALALLGSGRLRF